jgi:iron(III) transport system ATP-binding protein
MTSVRLEDISKSFGSTIALSDIDLKIEAGELFFLLGPSGCGKSTLLRLIAGLHEPSGGRIFFNDRDVTNLGTEKRNAVMCFQSYALWPHMTVRENVRFGLNVRGLPRAEQEKRVDAVLDLSPKFSKNSRPASRSCWSMMKTAKTRGTSSMPPRR